MTPNYKNDEQQLQRIVSSNVSTARDNQNLRLLIYYRNRKVRNLFIRNKTRDPNASTSDRHHVVYQYSCNREGCNASTYIGYTTTTIWDRFATHTSIKNHLREAHSINRIPRKDIIKDVSILRTCSTRRDLIFAEALSIKEHNPSLNGQEEGSKKILWIFKPY